jgi:hypothetical protein
MRYGRFCVEALAAVLALGCASGTTDVGRNGPGDASIAAPLRDANAYPPELREVQVGMLPFWGLDVGTNGFAQPVALDGVSVCVARARPYEPSLVGVADSGLGCAPPAKAGQNTVVEIPALSEAVVTAEHAGYRPEVYSVTTGPDSQAKPAEVQLYQMHLYAPDALPRLVPGADPQLGVIEAYLFACSTLASCQFLPGATLTLDPSGATGSGPFYAHGGAVDTTARTSLTGQAVTANPNVGDYAVAYFVNLQAREYALHIDHPVLTCSAWTTGSTFYGFAGSKGTIRVPVLAGHTTMVVAGCTCPDSMDAGDCARALQQGTSP